MEPCKITIHIWTPSSTFQEHRLVASWKGPVAVSLGNVGTSSLLQLSAGWWGRAGEFPAWHEPTATGL